MISWFSAYLCMSFLNLYHVTITSSMQIEVTWQPYKSCKTHMAHDFYAYLSESFGIIHFSTHLSATYKFITLQGGRLEVATPWINTPQGHHYTKTIKLNSGQPKCNYHSHMELLIRKPSKYKF